MGYRRSPLTKEARWIFLKTLESIDLAYSIEQRLRLDDDVLKVDDAAEIDLSVYKDIVIIGLGKASLCMGASIERLLGDRIRAGLLVTDRRHRIAVKSEVIVAGHPIPNLQSLIAGQKIIDLVRSCGRNSLIFFLVSGGGSALVDLPISDRVSLSDLQQVNRVLTSCGANIREINIVRKHLSAIKGGKLGHLAGDARRVVLFVSDVNPGDIHSIASNPVLPDPASIEDFQAVINDYALDDLFPQSIRMILTNRSLLELPRFQSQDLTTSIVLMENKDALAAAFRHVPYRCEVADDLIEGDYKTVSDILIERLQRLAARFPEEQVCLLSGGEVSCPVEGGGFGGRNQQFVLYSALRFASLEARGQMAALSCGTDGVDGNSVAAGAVADCNTVSGAERMGIDAREFLKQNDAFSLFNTVGGTVLTGPTGNNVRDVRIMLAGP